MKQGGRSIFAAAETQPLPTIYLLEQIHDTMKISRRLLRGQILPVHYGGSGLSHKTMPDINLVRAKQFTDFDNGTGACSIAAKY